VPAVRAAAGAVGARRAAVRAPGRGDGGADPAAAGDLLEPGGLWPLARAATPVLAGPTGRRGGGDLADAAGPGGGLGVAADLRGGGSSGLDSAGLAVAVRRARRADPGRVRAAGMACERGADMDRLAPAASRVADAVAQIGAACAAVRRAAGPAVFEVSSAELVAACSGGWLLATRPPAVAALSINTGPRL